MDGLVGWAFGGERRPGGPRVAFFMLCTMPILEYLQVYAKDNCFNKVVRLV